jgi:hypothetical protein
MKTLGALVMLTIPYLLLATGTPAAYQSNSQSQSDKQQAAASGTQAAATGDKPSDQDQPADQADPSNGAPSAGGACWKQAGISPKAMRTRQSILSNTRAELQKVNEDTSLAPQQKKGQVRQIRENAKQQIGKVITLEQQRTLEDCQRQRKGKLPPPSSLPPAPTDPS